jgi:nifR3 family TIM-barrel protein
MSSFWNTFKKPILALAPMEGVTDEAFRRVCKEQGADVVYTEFISSDAIAHNAKKALQKFRHDESERPVICQIFGRDPQAFAIAAKAVQAAGFDGLDINFGCPARKVVGHGSGVALLRTPTFARNLIEAAVQSVTIPVSIKVRTSIRAERKEVRDGAERITVLDFLDVIDDLPISAIMVHGRSFESGHQGSVDTEMIRKVKERFKGVVLANGGIMKPEDTVDMLQQTGADGVGIARGSWGAPWIFRDSRAAINGQPIHPPTDSELRAVILRHAELAYATKGDHGLIEFRKHAGNYLKGRPGANAFRRQAVTVTTLDDVRRLVATVLPE